ncbi:MAG: SprT-like domain-containing protein [Bacteroidales bacterium]|nr:SprT-like domain-containing protein [Bacteroidales bacterium]
MSKPATLQDYSDTLAPHLPPAALPYVAEFLFNNKISLVLSRPRRTKLGDYSFPNPLKRHGHRISVNANLDRNTFLWVMLHEIAHYQAFVAFGKRLKPHGDEFQAAFAKICVSSTKGTVFPLKQRDLSATFIPNYLCERAWNAK